MIRSKSQQHDPLRAGSVCSGQSLASYVLLFLKSDPSTAALLVSLALGRGTEGSGADRLHGVAVVQAGVVFVSKDSAEGFRLRAGFDPPTEPPRKRFGGLWGELARR